MKGKSFQTLLLHYLPREAFALDPDCPDGEYVIDFVKKVLAGQKLPTRTAAIPILMTELRIGRTLALHLLDETEKYSNPEDLPFKRGTGGPHPV